MFLPSAVSIWLTGCQQSNWPCRFILKTCSQQYYFGGFSCKFDRCLMTGAESSKVYEGYKRKSSNETVSECTRRAICIGTKSSACDLNMHKCLTCAAKVPTQSHTVTICDAFSQLLRCLQAPRPFAQLPITFTFSSTREPESPIAQSLPWHGRLFRLHMSLAAVRCWDISILM